MLRLRCSLRWRKQSSHSAICKAFISVVCALTSFAEILDLGQEWGYCRSFSTRAFLPRVEDRQPRGRDRLHAGDCSNISPYNCADNRQYQYQLGVLKVADNLEARLSFLSTTTAMAYTRGSWPIVIRTMHRCLCSVPSSNAVTVMS